MIKNLTLKSLPVLGCAILLTSPAMAALPAPVKSIIDAAIASGNDDEVKVAIKLAKATNPDDLAEIEAIESDYNAQQKIKLAEAEKAKQEELEQAGFFDNWTGQGELGAFRSSGNSSNTGITAGAKLTKEGNKWRYNFRAIADFQRTNGVTTREQYLAAIEPNYKINDRLYAFALGQYERDRFQGFSSRLTASGGLGYQVIDNEKTQLSVKAGPAFRQTNFIGGGSQSTLAGLAGLDFSQQLSKNLRFTENATAYIESANTTLSSETALEAKLSNALSARISYLVEYESSPPVGSVNTDTLTRITLVYGF